MKCMRRKYFVFSAVSFVLLFLNFSFFQSNILNKDSEVQEYYQNHPKNNIKQVNNSLNYVNYLHRKETFLRKIQNTGS